VNPKLFDVQVRRVRHLTPRVRELLLTTPNEKALPQWTAGAHIAVHLNLPERGLLVRHYSLVSSDEAYSDSAHTYRIAVQLEPNGIGSSYVHQRLTPGTRLQIGSPVNSFALDRQVPKVLLLAAGIGVTPLVSMAHSLLRRKQSFQMVYSGRSLDQMAYALSLKERCGDRLTLHTSDDGGQIDIKSLLAAQDHVTQVYACGPATFIHSAHQAALALGWTPERLRSEAFVSAVQAGDTPFTAVLQKSGRKVSVGSEESLLDALTRAHAPVYWDCRKGQCGLCVTKVLSTDGELTHRDRYLDDGEKAQGHSICLCVSRTRGTNLVLDI
jgi:ferredoxin-NADP reductase